MDVSDKKLDKLLDKMGVPEPPQTCKPVTDIVYNPNKKQIQIFSNTKKENKNFKKTIFKSGTLLVAAQPLHAFYLENVKQTPADAYFLNKRIEIGKNTALLVLKENIIKSQYNFSSRGFDFSIDIKGDIEACYRYITALTTWGSGISPTKAKWKKEGKPVYVQIFINPELSVEELKLYFQFKENTLSQERKDNYVYSGDLINLTNEIDQKLNKQRERIRERVFESIQKACANKIE